jgi:CRP-like cAMP-binding protein
MKHKIISVCEIESFKREEDQRKLVALYLQHLSFFKLMPFQMLLDIAGRLTVKHFEPQAIVCNQGDKGDQLYVIYKGAVLIAIVIIS